MPTNPTPEQLIAEVREKLAKITPGEWEPFDNYVGIGESMAEFGTDNPLAGDSSHDTYFVAAAPRLVRQLADALTAALERIKELENQLTR
jgi:hypothetical protein